MAWVERSGFRLYAERAGAGPALLYISGTGGDLRNRPNGFDTPGVGSFDCVCYDQRGLGRSGRPKDSYTMADFADDAAAMLDWAGWSRAAVLGVSFGGMVAQELILRHPDRVSRAVLACTSSGGIGGSSYPLHELATLRPEQRAAKTAELIDTRWANPANPDPLRKTTLSSLGAARALDGGAIAQLQARRGHDTWDRLAGVTCPVLVAAGRYDGIAPLANAEALAARIPRARLEVFEGGHLFLAQDPSAATKITAFLAAS